MPDADDIVALDETTVERIAAGEVVERPASVVKELVENSLDAGASRVDVTVERGGKDLVRVRDDGEGMTADAVRAAVRQHTTSKIADAADLDGGVSTLGFRGEALHTVGAVAKLTVRSKPRGGDRGTELRMEGGEVVAVEPTGCPEGTTVEVTDLFYNTPAREKYLKTDRTEFARVNDVATNYALASPDVAVSLTHDGREVFRTTGGGDRLETILAVYGREVAEAMVPVGPAPGAETAAVDDGDGARAEGPLATVEGYVSHPETTRSSREYVSAFVNGRYVQSAAAREAVVAAYGDQLASDRYPFAVLELSVPPGDVDVNVHPRKMEVRFADEAAVREQVEAAVREALLSNGLLRSGAPRGRSAPAETDVDPEPGDDVPVRDRTSAPADDGASSRGGNADGAAHAERRRGAFDRDTGLADRSDRGSTSTPAVRGNELRPVRGGEGDAGGADRTFDATEQRTLDGEPAPAERRFETLPPLGVLGQYDDTYVVAAGPGGLVLIDQHAADERVNYERLRERVDGASATQVLADPVEVALTAGEAAAFGDARATLEAAGFRARRAGERSVEVTGVPAVLSESLDPELLRDVLGRTLRDADGDRPVAARADALLADLACYPSITGNTSLTEGSVLALLSALDDCENPYACPHGRPVLVELSDDELEARFERDYPGHGGRRE